MDFLSLNSEYESRQMFNNQTMKTLEHFHSFFNTIYKNLSMFSASTHDALQLLFNDLMHYDNHSTSSKNFFEFYRCFEKFVAKTKQLSEKINYELVEPIELFHKHLQEKNTFILAELKEMISSISDQKKQYEISKHNYFDSCKTAEKQETKVIQSLDEKDKFNGTELEVEKNHDLLVQFRTIAEDNCQKYKFTLKTTNDFYVEAEKKYGPIAKKLQDNEESRKSFLKYHFEKFYSFIEDFNKSFTGMVNSLKETVVEVNIEEDLKRYEEKYSYWNKNNNRILKEDFLQYDIYRRNFEALINSNIKMFKTLPVNVPITKLSDLASFPVLIDSKKYSFNEKEEMVISSLFNENEMDKNSFGEFKIKLKTKQSFAKDFVDKLLEKCKVSIQMKIEHLDKLISFGECVSHVVMNEQINNNLFNLNFAIIYIAESTFFQLPSGQRLYLTRALSDLYPYFKSKSYWRKMLLLHLSSELDNMTNVEIRKKDNSGYSIGSIFNSIQAKEEYKQIFNGVQLKEIFGIIKEFLIHFANFSVASNDINDILIEVSGLYKLKEHQLSLLIAITNSNLHSIRARRYNSLPSANKKTVNKLAFLYNQSRLDQNFLKKKAFKSESSISCAVILNALKYLNHQEHIKVICLNHSYRKKTAKYIYQGLLWDHPELPFETRGTIWKNSVQYRTLTPYQSLYDSAKTYSSPLTEVIEMDAARTPFDKDQEGSRVKITNILRTLACHHEDIGYCQGMSYICSFFISLTDNEQNTFEIFNSILSNTEYGRLISNDFSLLKKYFYVFDRLLVIYIPEVACFLKKNSVFASYYIAPWFITLFTNSFSYLPKGQFPRIVIRIFDLFFLGGWNAIINTSLCLLKYYENDIIKMKLEELLHFLINDVVKFEFFHSSNYENFINLYNKMKISSGLISNLEKEYEQDTELK